MVFQEEDRQRKVRHCLHVIPALAFSKLLYLCLLLCHIGLCVYLQDVRVRCDV
jgi:hypothetical protein